MISTFDKQSSNIDSDDGFSPAKDPQNGSRASSFLDVHTELILVPPGAKYRDQVVPGYRN